MKIAFFGTSDRSTPILNTLKDRFDLKLCITKCDEPVGRKQELREVRVKKWAKDNKVDFVEIRNMKESKLDVMNEIKKRNIELGVMADFGFIVPKEVIDTLPMGIINIHFSTLPKYRGASPVQFALLNGDPKVGITYYLMDENMDTGDILEQYEYTIDANDTSGTLYEKLFVEASEKVASIIERYLGGKLKPRKQDDTHASYTYSRSRPRSTLVHKEDSKITWNIKPEEIKRVIKAYNPWPIAWTSLKELADGMGFETKSSKQNELYIKIYDANVTDGKLQIERIQVEGKKIMGWDDFKNGYLVG